MAYDPELANLLDTYRKAKNKAIYNKVWQGVGAFADSYRTGMPGAQALAMREPPKDYYTAAEKAQMSAPILQQLEESKREWGRLGMEQSRALADMRSENMRARATNANTLANTLADASAQKAGTATDQLRLQLQSHADTVQRATDTSAAKKSLEGVLSPRGNIYDEVSRLAAEEALAENGLTEMEDGSYARLNPDTQEYEAATPAQTARLVADAKAAERRIVEQLQTGNTAGDARLQDIAAANGMLNLPVLVDQLKALPAGDEGARIRLLEAYAEQTGIKQSDLLAQMPQEVARAVEIDRNSRDSVVIEADVALGETAKDAHKALKAVGASTQGVEAAIAELDALNAQGFAVGGGGSPETVGAPTEGGGASPETVGAPGGAPAAGPEGVGGGSPSGAGVQAAPTEGVGGGAPQSPEERKAAFWESLGFAGPPDGSGIKHLELILQRIEEMPELPAAKLAKQAILNSQQYQEWKSKHGITADSDLVFRAFNRDARARIGEARRQSAQQIYDGAAAGEIKGMGTGIGNLLTPKVKAADRYRERLKPPTPAAANPAAVPEEPPAVK